MTRVAVTLLACFALAAAASAQTNVRIRGTIKAGEYVFVSAQAASDGALAALRIQVSKDGVRPPL